MSKKVYVKPYPKEFREQVVKLVQLGDRDQGRRQDGLSSPEREELVRLRREIRRARENEALSRRITAIHAESREIYGARQRVARLMRLPLRWAWRKRMSGGCCGWG